MAHSCFLLESKGYRLLFDPYDPCIGYPPPKAFNVDLVVVSHDHFDHNAVDQVPGRTTVVRGVAKRSYGPLTLSGQVGWHGEGEGCDPVSLTLLEWGGRRLAHLGDIGRCLEPEQKEYFQDLDLLLLPCGGDYTIGGQAAAELVSQLKPKVAVPMHYRTPYLSRELFPGFETAESFLKGCSSFAEIRKVRRGWVELEEIWSQNQSETVVVQLEHQMG